MNRCKHFLRVGLALVFLAATAAMPVSPAYAQQAEEVKPNVRQFPKLAKRGELLVVTAPDILMDSKPDRLSPGVRIRDANNYLVLSGTLTNQKLLVRYTRDNIGLVHEIWVLNTEEARQKMPGEDGGGIWNKLTTLFDPPLAADDGNTPYNQLPAYRP